MLKWIFLLLPFSAWANGSVSFNYDLIRDWSEEAQSAEGCKAPYLVKYSRGDKKLYFVAAHHQDGPFEKNDTFKLIKRVFSDYRSKFLVIETAKTSLGVSPQEVLKDALECEKEGFKNCNERYFSVSMANKAGIPFIGGEIDDIDYMKELLPKYTADDVLGYFFYLATVRWKRREQLDFEKMALEAEKTQDFQKNFHQTMNYKQFKAWYKKRMGREFSLNEVDSQMLAPIRNSKKGILQSLAYDMDLVREPKILKVIEKAINEHREVIVVYGSGHHVKDGPVFKAALGSPVFECR